ncbi:MAG: putative sulfate/molybdate transporter, partial [Spirochaetota bacterium]
HLTLFRASEVWRSLLLAGLAQLPLTATNAVIATSALISHYWPQRPVSENRLALNQGVMNLVLPFFGGMPMCHGAGGLAGQYYFGARTGGTNLIEGLIEISLGLFLARSIGSLFAAFLSPIMGAMMLLVGLELVKSVRVRGADGFNGPGSCFTCCKSTLAVIWPRQWNHWTLSIDEETLRAGRE